MEYIAHWKDHNIKWFFKMGMIWRPVLYTTPNGGEYEESVAVYYSPIYLFYRKYRRKFLILLIEIFDIEIENMRSKKWHKKLLEKIRLDYNN